MFDQNATQPTNPTDDNPFQAAPSDAGLDAAAAAVDQFVPQSDATSSPALPVASATGAPTTDDLLSIKQEALQQLSPLVGHLDQSPEEKFRTTMMMIQAADDQSLLKSAYETAKEITDEKTRAQALLDIVNEINYFTQHHNHNS